MSDQPFFASLPMYDWPEFRAQNDQFWADIRVALEKKSIDIAPDLVRDPLAIGADDSGLAGLWTYPRMLLSQSCWGPLKSGYEEKVRILAQPSYSDFEGGDGALYRSVIIARDGVDIPPPDHEGAALSPDMFHGKNFVRNELQSMSGYLALEADLARMGGVPANAMPHFFHSVRLVGSHRAAIKEVAVGAADIAAIDIRSWAMALQVEPAARALKRVGWTSTRSGLPYICSKSIPEHLVQIMQTILLEKGGLRPSLGPIL